MATRDFTPDNIAYSSRVKKVQILAPNGSPISNNNRLPTDSVVSIDSMNLKAEMKVDSGHDLYLTQNNNIVADGWAVNFDSVIGLDLTHIQAVENKTKGWIYSTQGATVYNNRIELVEANQKEGAPQIETSDEVEIVYRGDSRFDGLATQATLNSIKEQTDKLKFSTDDLKITGSVTTDVETGLAKDTTIEKLKINPEETVILLSAGQEFTTSWVDTSNIDTVDVTGFNRIGLFVIPTKNDTENASIRVLGKLGANKYEIDGLSEKTIFTDGDAPLKYFEFDVGTLREIVVQIKAETVGATAGTVDIALNKAYRY